MFELSVKDIVNITSGRLLCGDENTIIRGICTNSKIIEEGNLFIPLPGEKTDGHLYIESALEIGAATLTSRHFDVVIAEKPYIQVHDTTRAMQKIAIYIRNKYHKPVIGVTGSVGKTTTREMIAAVLSQNIRVYQTPKNYNSQVGVPITFSLIDMDSEASVLEMGISKNGEMEILSDMVKPDIGVITSIGLAHIEHFKTMENTRNEKMKITAHMNPDGVLFLNGDEPLLAELKGKTPVKALFYGTQPWCDFRAENIEQTIGGITYDYVAGDVRIPVVLDVCGKHNVLNSLAGLAICQYMNFDVSKSVKGYLGFKGQRQRVINLKDRYTIIDDTYNASPDSMRASIDVLSDLETEGKRIAVLGDMFELGEGAEKYHYELGKYIATKNIDELAVVGELSLNIVKGVKDAGSDIKCNILKDNGEAVLYLMSIMADKDIVLVKGSHGMHMEKIVDNVIGKKEGIY